MENTLENKAKFFALYYGQNILRWHQWKNPNEYSKVGFAPMQSKENVDNGWYLELKPLSAITDEDLIGLAKANKSVATVYQGGIVLELFHKRNHSIEAIDYLRSKGYALPFHNLSIEQLQEYGWIRLTPAP